jgi:hypothetical protein
MKFLKKIIKEPKTDKVDKIYVEYIGKNSIIKNKVYNVTFGISMEKIKKAVKKQLPNKTVTRITRSEIV